jgi:hypothetical protein
MQSQAGSLPATIRVGAAELRSTPSTKEFNAAQVTNSKPEKMAALTHSLHAWCGLITTLFAAATPSSR